MVKMSFGLAMISVFGTLLLSFVHTRPSSLDYGDDLFREDFYQGGTELQRQERDGGSHGLHGQRHGRRNEPVIQDEREGRQTGGTAAALGVLNNPPSEDGSYNFK